MNCEEARVMLEERVQDADVRTHLQTCAECRDYAATMKADNVVLAKALGREVDEARFQAMKGRVMRQIPARAIPLRPSRRKFWFASAAAAVVMIAAAGVYFGRAHTHHRQDMLQALAKLQDKVRDKQVLDEVEQLQIAFADAGDEEAKSIAEDVELYVERLLAADFEHPDRTREILHGIRNAGIAARVKHLRETMGEDAPVPVVNSIELALSTLNEAVRLADAGAEINAH